VTRWAPHPHEAPGLEAMMRRASEAVKKELPPDVGFAVFVFHSGEGGYLAYGSNAEREDMVKTIGEWFLTQFPSGGPGSK
jgi:hypothetical protein